MHKQAAALVRAVRVVYPHHRTNIESLKCECRRLWNVPHFMWEQLLRSFSAMGNARGLRLMHFDRAMAGPADFLLLISG